MSQKCHGNTFHFIVPFISSPIHFKGKSHRGRRGGGGEDVVFFGGGGYRFLKKQNITMTAFLLFLMSVYTRKLNRNTGNTLGP